MPDQPVDPAAQTADEVRAMLTEPSPSGAAAVDYGPEEESSAKAAIRAAEALTNALGVETAKAAALSGELAYGEVEQAIERGLPADEVLAAGLSSGAVSQDAADALSWDLARQDAGYETDAELDEFADDDEWDAIDEQQQQLLGAASGLAEIERDGKRQQQASEAAFKQATANHEKSSAALRAFQHELGYDGAQMRAHLGAVEAAMNEGILGVSSSLEDVAQTDPRLFDSALRSVSATLRQSVDEEQAAALKAGILSHQHDLADGLVIDGVPVKEGPLLPEFNEENFSDAVGRRALSRSRSRPSDLLPPPRASVSGGFTLDGRKVSPDDIPTGQDGLSARERLTKEQQTGRAG